MKYLAYFRPNKDLSRVILKQNNIVLPGSGLHCTLCYFYMNPDMENNLVSDLSAIEFSKFEVETKDFDYFDNESLVLKLSRPTELLNLHKNIVSAVEKSAYPFFRKISGRYFKDKYNPHITISKSDSGFDRNTKDLFGQKNNISKYYLARKNDTNWEEVQTYFCRD